MAEGIRQSADWDHRLSKWVRRKCDSIMVTVRDKEHTRQSNDNKSTGTRTVKPGNSG